MLHPSPITTSPTIVAFGATKQPLGIMGALPFTGKMKAIKLSWVYKFKLTNKVGKKVVLELF
jgi:hypothetical protein